MTYISKKIILTGYMGSGKSSISHCLANKINLPVFDLDALIEKNEGKTIAEIFKSKGELYFRKQEYLLLHNFIKNTPKYVLSLGGGTPCYAENYKVFDTKNIVSIYLKASPKTLASRLLTEISNRPLIEHLTEDTLEEYISKHLFERNQFYRKAIHTISVDDKTIDEIIDEILGILNPKRL